jgi:hypothetical protein
MVILLKQIIHLPFNLYLVIITQHMEAGLAVKAKEGFSSNR